MKGKREAGTREKTRKYKKEHEIKGKKVNSGRGMGEETREKLQSQWGKRRNGRKRGREKGACGRELAALSTPRAQLATICTQS